MIKNSDLKIVEEVKEGSKTSFHIYFVWMI